MTDAANECLTKWEKLLLSKFRQEFKRRGERSPEWALPLRNGSPMPPPVPLVGSAYTPGRGLLVYASAEKLARMERDHSHSRWEFFCDGKGWARYRQQYSSPILQSGRRDRFPVIGIQPVTDGGLLCAAWFLLDRFGMPAGSTPQEVLENIAVTNWCKFVWRAEGTPDYVGDSEKLGHSLPYVEIELKALRPQVVLLPHRIWNNEMICDRMSRSAPKACFVPAPQFNARVINTNPHLRCLDTQARNLQGRHPNKDLKFWMSRVERMNPGNAWRFLAYLEQLVRQSPNGASGIGGPVQAR